MHEDPARSGAASASRSWPYAHGTVPLLEQSPLTTAVKLGCFIPLPMASGLVDRLEHLAGIAIAIEARASALPARRERKRR